MRRILAEQPTSSSLALVALAHGDEPEIRVVCPSGPERGDLLNELMRRALKAFPGATDVEILGRAPGTGPRVRLRQTVVEFLTPEEETERETREVEAAREG